MATELDFPARGKVIKTADGAVIFNPANTNYELQLQTGSYDGPVGSPIDALIRVQARKVWTVPSGGNFVTPIMGTPRIIQGRVRYLTPQIAVIHAGTNIIVELPDIDTSYDLTNGPVAVGSIVNVTVLPGARFELARQLAGR